MNPQHSVISLLTYLLIPIFIPGMVFSTPNWVSQKPDRPDLLQGIGIANDTGSPEEDQQRADNNAIAEILNEIRTTVTSTMESYYHEEIKDGEVISSSDVVSTISARYAQETVEGIRITERHYDKKKRVYYAYAYITKEQLERQFKAKADEVKKLCADYHRFALQSLDQHDVYTALGKYIRALSELFVVQAYLKEKIQGNLSGVGRSEMLQARIESEISNIIGRLQIQVFSGDGQKAQRNRALDNPLVGKVVYTDNLGVFPVFNIPVTLEFENADGDLTANLVTNKIGLFTCYVNMIESAESETGIIKAGFDLTDLKPFRGELGSVFQRLEKVGCSFTFNIDVAASIRIFVSIYEEIDGNAVDKPCCTGVLINSLVKNKYSVVDIDHLSSTFTKVDIERAVRNGDDRMVVNAAKNDAGYAVIGVISSKAESKGDFGITFAYADADVRVIDLNSGRVVASSVESGIKGAGNNSSTANKKAVEKCVASVESDIIRGLETALK